MRNKIQAPGKQVLHKQVPKAQALQKEKDPRLVAVGGFGQVLPIFLLYHTIGVFVNSDACRERACQKLRPGRPASLIVANSIHQVHRY